MDKDSDGLISRDEFLKSTQDPEFEKDNEWKPVVDDDEYSEDELKDYERQLAEEATRNAEVRRTFVNEMLLFCHGTSMCSITIFHFNCKVHPKVFNIKILDKIRRSTTICYLSRHVSDSSSILSCLIQNTT